MKILLSELSLDLMASATLSELSELIRWNSVSPFPTMSTIDDID